MYVRRKNPVTLSYAHMALQLYQVDYKSHLLDFMIIPNDGTKASATERSKYCILLRMLSKLCVCVIRW